jgi:ubiquinone/menaquinone biosynthesis C-methylase UbiE
MPERRSPIARPRRRPAASTSWDPLAHWYNGWVGEGGSEYHRHVAVPALLRLLDPQPGDRILDIGAGQGVLTAAIVRAGASYVGIDASPRLIQMARKTHAREGKFYVGDARHLEKVQEIERASFDAAVFLLSLQDMDPLEQVLESAGRALKQGGRMVLLLTHPAFRVPRQSGWGWDEGRKLVFRRVDRYLTPLPVPMKAYRGKDVQATTRSFHRPLSAYVNALSDVGMCVDRMEEIPAHKIAELGAGKRAENMARQEIPLFLTLRARKNQRISEPAPPARPTPRN